MTYESDAEKELTTGDDEEEPQAVPVGMSVYVSDPLAWVIVSVSMPDEQVWLRLPPLPKVEEDSACGGVG